MGDNSHLWIDEFLSNKQDYARNVRKARALKQWIIENQYENRLDDACKSAMAMNSFSISILQNLIKSKSYLKLNNKINQTATDIQHENVRGGSYYQNILQINKDLENNHA